MTMAEFLKQKGKRESQIEIVLNCLKEGLEIEIINRITGLSKKEINKIAAEHKLH